jgi:predicted transcriptional regulator of viral defense system
MRRDPLALRRALTQVAAQQAGHFSAQQALEVGYTYQVQRYHVQRGEWLRVDRGIFRLTDWPTSQHEDLVRWTLWSRGRAVISHETALAVLELGEVMPARVHITVSPGFRMRASAVVVHRALLEPSEVEAFEGFSVTTPVRSILDAAAGGTEVDQLARTIRDALERGLLTARSLRARADKFGATAALAIERALRQEDL